MLYQRQVIWGQNSVIVIDKHEQFRTYSHNHNMGSWLLDLAELVKIVGDHYHTSYTAGDEMKLLLGSSVSLLLVLFICASDASFSDSGVPCYLHPSADKCHYRIKPDSPTCTSAEQRQRLTDGIRELNRTFTILETKLIRLGISTYNKTP